jgi:protein ImuB
MLWIALFLPELPLQLAQRAEPTPRPCVIAEGPSLRPLVLCANAAACAQGITPQMTVAAARALAGELVVLPRDENAEAQALHNLGCWAAQFTPGVVLQQGEGLLLEVASTLQLHGGLKRLVSRIRADILKLGYHAEPGVAPTPRAAWLLAKARHAGNRTRMCTDPALLQQRLDPLPLPLLDWPADVLTTLQTLGVRRLGQLLSLPRDGFITRFGAERRLQLDQALGTAADPRSWFLLPETFSSRIEFGFDVNDALALLFPLRRLLQELEGFLRGRGAGVQRWQLLLEHWNHGRTTIVIGTVTPERNAERFLALAREKLTQLALTAPVLALGIAATQLSVFEENNRSFIPDPRSRAIGWGHLVDKLATRLGNDKVYRLHTVDDHRPERAYQQHDEITTTSRPLSRKQHNDAAAKNSAASLLHAPRPLWLLRTPRALLTDNDAPLCQGRLRILAGPERIESGWWDGDAARRDYYVARNPQGQTFWIYREHQRGSPWLLHGIFG